MTLHNRLFKSLLIASVFATAIPAATPAFAAQADIDLLKSYIGDWKGRGTTTASGDPETVVCKLDITDASKTKINYNGRCTLAGGNLSIAGTMAYIDEHKRFEAVMSSNTSFSGVAIGRRRGRGIDFQLRNRDKDSGADFTIDAGISLKSGNIEVKFSVTEIDSGKKIIATVPFKK